MLVNLDWLSFTLKLSDRAGEDERDTEEAVLVALHELEPMLQDWLELDENWTRLKGRAPYSIAWQHPKGGMTVYYHPRLNHCLFEVSGQGCSRLYQNDEMHNFLDAVQQRLTRIDIACDITTDVRPLEFVTLREGGKFTSHSEIFSESGETCYIGSRSSNRFCRVYRYNPPHERHMFLRAEFEVKAQDAKLTAAAILDQGLIPVVSALGIKFGFQHPTWAVAAATPAELASYRPDRKAGKTMFWLNDTIAPLIRRLHADGIMNAEQWFQENIRRFLGDDELPF